MRSLQVTSSVTQGTKPRSPRKSLLDQRTWRVPYHELGPVHRIEFPEHVDAKANRYQRTKPVINEWAHIRLRSFCCGRVTVSLQAEFGIAPLTSTRANQTSCGTIWMDGR